VVFINLNGVSPIMLAVMATLFTWGMTALGAAVVFLFKSVDRKILDFMLAFGGGVMIAASFFSLLSPAIDISLENGETIAISVFSGFFFGGILIVMGNVFLERRFKEEENNENKMSLRRSLLMVFAITLHNFPEGLAIGVAFGSIYNGIDGALVGALALALGIGIQNFPEGMAVSLPLRREGMSRRKSFFYGQLSGVVEPIGGVIGVIFATTATIFLPFLLSFAAGAMIIVAVSELIPESTKSNRNLSSMGAVIGFSVMMILDVTLG